MGGRPVMCDLTYCDVQIGVGGVLYVNAKQCLSRLLQCTCMMGHREWVAGQ